MTSPAPSPPREGTPASEGCFFREQRRAKAVVLLLAGVVLLASHVGETDWMGAFLGSVSAASGAAWLVLQLRAYAILRDGRLEVRERFFARPRAVALAEADRWEAYEHPDCLELRQGERLLARFPLSPLPRPERERLLERLARLLPGERLGA